MSGRGQFSAGRGGSGGTKPAGRDERKGRARNAQLQKMEHKQNDEADFFFRCVQQAKSGKKRSNSKMSETELFGSGAGAGGGINFDMYDKIEVARKGESSREIPALEDFQDLYKVSLSLV